MKSASNWAPPSRNEAFAYSEQPEEITTEAVAKAARSSHAEAEAVAKRAAAITDSKYNEGDVLRPTEFSKRVVSEVIADPNHDPMTIPRYISRTAIAAARSEVDSYKPKQ